MSDTINDIDKFHGTRKGKLVFAAVELILACVLVSRAIDTGSLWQYLFALLFFVGGLNNLFKSVKRQTKKDAPIKAKKR